MNSRLFSATTDRRPVDPPPVVQLQIFEHGKSEPKAFTDITQYYPANFFVYVTLECESAPKTEPGRGSNGKVKQLTGTPNTGGLYLDRPDKAVFFTFGDLSVRSEGLYKLKFNLYEVPFCQHLTDIVMDAGNKQAGELGFAFGRAQVQSNTFEVFSAKKFPGLAESTLLSRTLSEQGCKVRIRRDVRVRKHNSKDGPQAGTISDVGTDDEDEESDDAQSSQITSTPATARPTLDSSDGKQSFSGSAFSVTIPAQHYTPQPQSQGQSRPQSSQSQQQQVQAPHHTPGSSIQSAIQGPEQPVATWQHNDKMQQQHSIAPPNMPPPMQYLPPQPTYQYLTHYGHHQMAPTPPVPSVYGAVSYHPGYAPPVTYSPHYQPHQSHGAYTYAPAAVGQDWASTSDMSQQQSHINDPMPIDQELRQHQSQADNCSNQYRSLDCAQQQQQQSYEDSQPRRDPEIERKWQRAQPDFYRQYVPPPPWAGGPEFPVEDPRYDMRNCSRDWSYVEPPAWAKTSPAGSKRTFDETEDTTYVNMPIKSGDRPDNKAWYEDDESKEQLDVLCNQLVLRRADGWTSTIAEGRIRYAAAAKERAENLEYLKQYEDHRRQVLARAGLV